MRAWSKRRVDHVAQEQRITVLPSGLGSTEVFLYSIPAFDETGDGRVELAEQIGSAKTRLQGGEVLTSKLNPRKPRVLVAEAHSIPTVCSGEFVVLRPHAVETRFLAYLLKAEVTRQKLDSVVQSVTRSHQRARPEDVTKLWVSLPERDRQRTIVDVLDAETARIDALIERKLRMIRLARQRLLSHAVEATRPADTIVLPLRRVIRSLQTGATPSTVEEALFSDDEVPWFSPGDFGEATRLDLPSRHLSEEAIRVGAAPRFPADSTLVVGIGATVGRVAHLDYAASGNQQLTCLVAGDRMVPRFLTWQLWSRRDELLETAPRTTLPIMSNEFLKSLLVAVPPLSIQETVVGRLQDAAITVETMVDKLKRQVMLLAEHRQALITAAVTGQLDRVEAAA